MFTDYNCESYVKNVQRVIVTNVPLGRNFFDNSVVFQRPQKYTFSHNLGPRAYCKGGYEVDSPNEKRHWAAYNGGKRVLDTAQRAQESHSGT